MYDLIDEILKQLLLLRHVIPSEEDELPQEELHPKVEPVPVPAPEAQAPRVAKQRKMIVDEIRPPNVQICDYDKNVLYESVLTLRQKELEGILDTLMALNNSILPDFPIEIFFLYPDIIKVWYCLFLTCVSHCWRCCIQQTYHNRFKMVLCDVSPQFPKRYSLNQIEFVILKSKSHIFAVWRLHIHCPC